MSKPVSILITEILEDARLDERRAIVAWLRDMADCCESAEQIGASKERTEAFRYAADAIEAGDHMTRECDG